MIGSTVGTMLGGPVGGEAGALVGNVVGGALLGPAHHAAEVACTKIRRAWGGSVAYRPDVNGERAKNFRENSFVATFATAMAVKAWVKSAAVTGAPWPAALTGFALDIGFSGTAGAVAQTAQNTRKALIGNTELKYVPLKNTELNSREARIRMGAGAITGAVAGVADVASSLLSPGVATAGTHVGRALLGGVKTVAVLLTWFKLRDTGSGILSPSRPAPAASATNAAVVGSAMGNGVSATAAQVAQHAVSKEEQIENEADVFHDAMDSGHADLGRSASSSPAIEEEVFHDASDELHDQSPTPAGAAPASAQVTEENDGRITKL
ncbi:hypothetical protein J2W35_004192 [Variovorax boronicumulans]|uniref:hypothetical protein n=1 Tax=Variovorax boronicumulans TaxID=436515 RepID=UPI002785C1B3|nr:hypothetical protein [Variovorax boronicumulans]MDQ0083826.1 hypothetical protein [Variovorax boronicumulans]